MPHSVLKAVLPHVTIEGDAAALPKGDRVAVVASYSTVDVVSRSLAAMVDGLRDCGYAVVVVRASDDRRPLQWPTGSPPADVVLRKPNIGYDFGSWATALKLVRGIRKRPYVLLTNDSLVGPFSSLRTLVDDFEGSAADVWGATSTRQIFPHLQSYFLGFRNGVLRDRAIRQFWSTMPIESKKSLIVDRYEIGLSRLLLAEGFTTSAAFESERLVDGNQNPTLHGWRSLLELGFPFVKRELLTNPAVVSDGAEVPAVVQALYGTDPREWL